MRFIVIFVAFGFCAPAFGCDDGGDGSGTPRCVPGDVQLCVFPEDLSPGSHTCGAEGTWEPCQPESNDASCIGQFQLGCHTDGHVHWYDSCGELGSMAQPCAPCERCEQYDQAAATCEASALEDHKECGDEGQVYWHDSCGVRGQLAESCAAPQSACFDGACACPAGRSGPECLDCEGGRYDSVQKLCWLQPAVSPTQHCIESQDYCAALDQAGHTDWRIPTKAEFMELLGGCDSAVQSLYSNGYCDSCAQSDRCTDLLGADSGIYWTFTTGGVSDMELAVNFGTGFFFGDGCHISSHQTRCVRSVE